MFLDNSRSCCTRTRTHTQNTRHTCTTAGNQNVVSSCIVYRHQTSTGTTDEDFHKAQRRQTTRRPDGDKDKIGTRRERAAGTERPRQAAGPRCDYDETRAHVASIHRSIITQHFLTFTATPHGSRQPNRQAHNRQAHETHKVARLDTPTDAAGAEAHAPTQQNAYYMNGAHTGRKRGPRR